MTLRSYLGSKTVTLCFIGIGALSCAFILAVLETSPVLIGVLLSFLVLLTACWLIVSWLLERARLFRLQRLIEGLSDKYLLGELLPRPTDPVQAEYYDIMKTVSRSAIGVTEQALREKDDYCSYVESWVHEIKTPLTACSLILANGSDPAKLKQELKRADNLTENILYYARLRSAEKDLQIREFNVSSVIHEAVQSQMELLIAAHIQVAVNGDFLLCSDSSALRFILKQLLINCAQYCPGCLITITAEQNTITVEDNGIGIPQHELRRVTERGYTGSNGRKNGSSTGMGLYLVNQLCKKLEIRLSIASESGKYTRIQLSFQNLS